MFPALPKGFFNWTFIQLDRAALHNGQPDHPSGTSCFTAHPPNPSGQSTRLTPLPDTSELPRSSSSRLSVAAAHT